MRVLPLGDDNQTELPRRPEFWLGPREFGVVEEWVGWLAVNGIEPLTDRSVAGLRALVKAHADQAVGPSPLPRTSPQSTVEGAE